ncbi:MAG: hypothetical protein REI94_12220 [Moraxellaceae bacterium]|nr:hypothetical protein [Moraxellaceae bacterium]
MKLTRPTPLTTAALCGAILLSAIWFDRSTAAPEALASATAMPPGTVVYDDELREFAKLDSSRAGDPPDAAILLVESHAGARVRMAVPQEALRVAEDNRLVLQSFGDANARASARRPVERQRTLFL